ncbi:hypothetical protein BG006_005905 [Podila minutissima]|uniref:Uncharacterized protein n=1 Tax=Podila minutissima TaxID=64525 RepID=A0A9P5SS74_9FUNG|nr:hypothetical protein BG006_005905 [Podila minutissima]
MAAPQARNMSTHTNMSERHLALTIPHICDDIVRHLSNKDVHSCITVSKDFHEAFVHYNWRTVSIPERDKYNSLCTNILASESQILIETQPKIQSLSSVYGEIWDLFVKRVNISSSDTTDTLVPEYTPRASFTNLIILHAFSNTDEVGGSINNPKYVQQLLAVIEHSPRLEI